MERIKVPSGTSQKMETAFDNVQNMSEQNIKNRFSSIFNTHGVNSDEYLDADMAIRLVDNASFSISPGFAYLGNGEIVELGSTVTVDWAGTYDSIIPTIGATNTCYLLRLYYYASPGNPVTAMSAFVYDKNGGDGSINKYTTYSDSWSIEGEIITSMDNIESYANDNSLVLGIIKTSSGSIEQLNNGAWSLGTTASEDGVIDLRYINYLKINKSVLNEDDIIFKDRDSIGSKKLLGSLELQDNLIVDGDIHISGILTTSGLLLTYDTGAYMHLIASGVNYYTAALPTSTFGKGQYFYSSNLDPWIFSAPDLISPIVSINPRIGSVGINQIPTYSGSLDITGDIHLNGGNIYVGDYTVQLDQSADLLQTISNFRIKEVFGHRTEYIDPTVSGIILNTNTNVDYSLNVRIAWGYEGVTGTGGTNSFVAEAPDNAFNSLGANALQNAYLYMPSIAKNLRIIANTAGSNSTTTLTVRQEDGTTWNGTGCNASGDTAAIIHYNVNEYKLIAIPTNAAGDEQASSSYAYEQSVTRQYNDAAPVMMKTVMRLLTGVKYKIGIFGRKGIRRTPTTYYNNGNPWTVRINNINADGHMEVTPSEAGFSIVMSGWESAEHYQIAWNPQLASETEDSLSIGASFSPSADIIKELPISVKRLEVAVPASTKYNIKARPLIGGQSVCNYVSANVIAGAFGNMPQGVPIFSSYITHRTISSAFTYTPLSPEWMISLTAGAMYSPAGQSKGPEYTTQLDSSYIGMIFNDGSRDYLIDAVVDGNRMCVVPAGPDVTAEPVAGASGKIGCGRPKADYMAHRGRILAEMKSLPNEYVITGICFVCDSFNSSQVGGKATIRAYQTEAGQELGNTGFLSFNSTGTYVQIMDEIIAMAYGPLDLTIDAFDPADSDFDNVSSFAGQLTVYATPYATKTGRVKPITNPDTSLRY